MASPGFEYASDCHCNVVMRVGGGGEIWALAGVDREIIEVMMPTKAKTRIMAPIALLIIHMERRLK